MFNQFTHGLERRVMYVENKATGEARVTWVEFSRTGRTVYALDRTLRRARGISGNFEDVEMGEEFWVSAPKRRGGAGANTHPGERGTRVSIDPDVRDGR